MQFVSSSDKLQKNTVEFVKQKRIDCMLTMAVQPQTLVFYDCHLWKPNMKNHMSF